MRPVRVLLSILGLCALASCAVVQPAADPASDAPEHRLSRPTAERLPASYAEAVRTWHGADEVNSWIAARFEYDTARAVRLAESQRSLVDRVRIHPPEAFFADPTGVCVDLARFAVETLRVVAPESRPKYLMIEFDPVVISGATLRRHWLVAYEREGALYLFADSKRPGHVAGPYTDVAQFIEQYATYRGRRIVSFRITDTYERTLKQRAPRATRAGRG